MSLRLFDNNILDDDDQYETPKELYESLCKKYNLSPKLDVAANLKNKKCVFYLTDALHENWALDSWCNPPHSKTEDFVKRADNQWLDQNINILMIVPANSICTHYFDSIFEMGHAEYHRISGRPQFLRDGKLSKNSSRNSYFVVIWRKI